MTTGTQNPVSNSTIEIRASIKKRSGLNAPGSADEEGDSELTLADHLHKANEDAKRHRTDYDRIDGRQQTACRSHDASDIRRISGKARSDSGESNES